MRPMQAPRSCSRSAIHRRIVQPLAQCGVDCGRRNRSLLELPLAAAAGGGGGAEERLVGSAHHQRRSRSAAQAPQRRRMQSL